MGETTYLVTEGAHESYGVIASFGTDKAAAEKFAADYNGREGLDDDYYAASVEAFRVRSADWRGDVHASMRTRLDAETAETRFEDGYSESTKYEDVPDQPSTHSTDQWHYGHRIVTVYTTGRPEHVRQAHADAVALAKAQILGT
ncbi:hypothetical protein ACFY9R_26500 [Streptomyces albidoflavus]|uniref:hypothetical protein n=1 Tax=Streptomyces albidoflavus TaxID=1886 RepID=UPI00340B72B2